MTKTREQKVAEAAAVIRRWVHILALRRLAEDTARAFQRCNSDLRETLKSLIVGDDHGRNQ
jgi:hypothetical protein